MLYSLLSWFPKKALSESVVTAIHPQWRVWILLFPHRVILSCDAKTSMSEWMKWFIFRDLKQLLLIHCCFLIVFSSSLSNSSVPIPMLLGITPHKPCSMLFSHHSLASLIPSLLGMLKKLLCQSGGKFI